MQTFDLWKRTLTDFNPAEYAAASAAAAGAAPRPQPTADGDLLPDSEAVPTGRTTLNISKVRGIIQPTAKPPRTKSAAPPEAPAAAAVVEPVQAQAEAPAAAAVVEPVQAQAEAPAPIVGDSDPDNDPDDEDDDDAAPEWTEPETAADVLPIVVPTEAAAALHVRAAPRPKKQAINPEDMIAVNLRIPKYLKDTFFRICREKEVTPSRVIRNMLKNYCGL